MNLSWRAFSICTLLFGQSGIASAEANQSRTEMFDREPGWEGFNNRVVPTRIPTVTQDFGYSASNFAGKESGEMGGRIWRTLRRASYAAKIAEKNLGQKLSASGAFAVTATSGSSGAFFGWFNSRNTGDGRRDTLGFRFAAEGSGARLTLQLVTDKNQACGTKVTPWIVDKAKARGEGRKYRPTSIRNDGTRYDWTLSYDPDADGGNGRIQFTIRGERSPHDEFETKAHTVVLPAGYKEHGTSFDRFGLMNCEKAGNPMTIYFDDLQFDGQSEDFSRDPGWLGAGNRDTFQDPHQGGAHAFGFCPQGNHAGGSPGEVGGLIWRSGVYGYYADRVGPLTLADRLEAKGKVVLEAAQPDSGMYLGWFNSAEKENAPSQAGEFVGVKVGGPTRVGHYFVPCYATRKVATTAVVAPRQHMKRVSVEPGKGPVLVPQKVFDWSLVYDPAGNGGTGVLEVTLGTDSVSLPLRKGDKAVGATMDRFGLFTSHIGGSFVRIYFDDLTYTATQSDVLRKDAVHRGSSTHPSASLSSCPRSITIGSWSARKAGPSAIAF